ncbi:MAG: nitrile hydratase subunit beta [Gammaproteobacteria bacterium]
MNGIHDVGGMHNMGRIVHDGIEMPFRERWEGRSRALGQVMRPFRPEKRRKNFRYLYEMVPPLDYLRMSYYEKLFDVFVQGLIEDRTITQAELASGRPARGLQRETPRITPAMVVQRFSNTKSTSLRRDDVQVSAGFVAGQPVRARNINPVGHTRLPRYLRGRIGVIARDHGVFDFQDTDSQGYALADDPQHVYTVRFEARELWGADASSRDCVHAELWEKHLERV